MLKLNDDQVFKKCGYTAAIIDLEDRLTEAIKNYNDVVASKLNAIRFLRDRLNTKRAEVKTWLESVAFELASELETESDADKTDLAKAIEQAWVDEIAEKARDIGPVTINGHHDITEGDYCPKRLEAELNVGESIYNLDEEAMPTLVEVEDTQERTPSRARRALELADTDDNFIFWPGRPFMKAEGRMIEVLDEETKQIQRIPDPKDEFYKEIPIHR